MVGCHGGGAKEGTVSVEVVVSGSGSEWWLLWCVPDEAR
jgi:hypothetical protein